MEVILSSEPRVASRINEFFRYLLQASLGFWLLSQGLGFKTCKFAEAGTEVLIVCKNKKNTHTHTHSAEACKQNRDGQLVETTKCSPGPTPYAHQHVHGTVERNGTDCVRIDVKACNITYTCTREFNRTPRTPRMIKPTSLLRITAPRQTQQQSHCRSRVII
jgi:hypothetical protein